MTEFMKSSFPRLLLLSAESPHSSSPGGIFLQRLLQDYPMRDLLVVTNHLPPVDAERLDCQYRHAPLVADRLNRTRFSLWRPLLRIFGASELVSLAALDAACADFSPEVVVSVMQDSWFYDLAARYASHRNLPLVLIVHDLQQGFEQVPPWARSRQHARDKKVVKQAVTRLCVSEPMVDFFANEYDAPAHLLLPPRAEKPVMQSPERCAELKHVSRLTLGYAGGLHYGYGEQLLRMIPALRSTGTRVEVFGPRPAGVVAPLNDATDVFTFRGLAPTPNEAWRGLLDSCDAILQPYLNPPGIHEMQYRTHFPSKLGDALSLGLPLLVTGPDYASGMAWCAEKGNCALLVTDPSETALAEALIRLRSDGALRSELARNAGMAAVSFDVRILRDQFHSTLQLAAGKSLP